MHCGLHRAFLWLLSYPWDSTWSALGHLLRRALSPLGRASLSFLMSVSPWPSSASTFPTTTFVTCYCEHNIQWEKGWFCSSSSLYSQNLDRFWLKDGAQYMCWMTKHGQSQALKHGHSLWQHAGASPLQGAGADHSKLLPDSGFGGPQGEQTPRSVPGGDEAVAHLLNDHLTSNLNSLPCSPSFPVSPGNLASSLVSVSSEICPMVQFISPLPRSHATSLLYPVLLTLPHKLSDLGEVSLLLDLWSLKWGWQYPLHVFAVRVLRVSECKELSTRFEM